MRKKSKILLLLFGICFLTGCGNKNKSVVDGITKKIKDINSYQITGILEVVNNETTYKYDIDVSYMKDEKYKVTLKNQVNNHEQVILKNDTGVYVKTQESTKQKLNVI